jgi:hypothetical protein
VLFKGLPFCERAHSFAGKNANECSSKIQSKQIANIAVAALSNSKNQKPEPLPDLLLMQQNRDSNFILLEIHNQLTPRRNNIVYCFINKGMQSALRMSCFIPHISECTHGIYVLSMALNYLF